MAEGKGGSAGAGRGEGGNEEDCRENEKYVLIKDIDMTNETLKQIRVNALGFSVKEMAEKLNMPISEYEKIENEHPIPLAMLMKVAQSVGKPIDFLLNMQKEEIKFDIKDGWSSIYDVERKLSQFLITHRSSIDSESLLNILRKTIRKPRIAFVGHSDVGKSTLINTLLGSNTLPVSWTPTTSIIVYVKHIKDKPSYIKDDVAIFHAGESGELWDDTKLGEHEYTESYLIATGDYSLLREYGARQGSKFDDTNAVSAVVFVDSDILNNCDLVDLPGYGTGDREADDSLLTKMKGIDILVYMSTAIQFMQGPDFLWLQNLLPNLSSLSLNNKLLRPLSNLYVVASQAQNVHNGSNEQLNYILNEAVERFGKTLPDNYWNKFGQNVSLETFRKRLFTYSTDQKSLRKDFEDDLRSLLEKLPQVIAQDLLSMLMDNVKQRIENLEVRIKSFRQTLSDRNEKKKRLEQVLANEPERINRNTMAKQKIFDQINQFKQEATIDFIEKYNQIINKENIIKQIEDNDWKERKEDMELLSQKISNLLNEANSTITLQYSEKFKDLVNQYINDFKTETHLELLETEINGNVGFNFIASFAGGLAGLAAYGALAVWAASLGNLGAYILVAKGVSLLAALGISVGGTAAVISTISAIGGPIVIAVGLAVLIAVAIYTMVRNWKDDIAKIIIKEYDKQNVLEEYKAAIAQYWDDTKAAFISSSDNMEREYKEYLETLKNDINKTNDEELKQKIEAEEEKINIYNQLINNLTK